jgi:ADP-heptose:LPS heptosyltransferase
LDKAVRYEVLDYLELIEVIGGSDAGQELELSVSEDDAKAANQFVIDAGLDPEAGYGVMAVGGGRNPGWDVPQKRWSIANFAAVIQDVNIPWIVVGDEYDRRELESILLDRDGVVNLCSKLTLMQSAALIQRAKLLLTNDTVAMHFGVATGAQTVALFGPTHPKALVPEGIKHVRILQGKLACVPCFWQGMSGHVSNFGDANFPGCSYSDTGSPCLDTVTVSKVVIEIKAIMESTKVGSK